MSNGIEADIITWDELYEATLDNLSFGSCDFKKDFGPWKLNDNVGNITFDFENCLVKEYDAEGNIVKQCSIGLVALDVLDVLDGVVALDGVDCGTLQTNEE